MHDVAPDPEKVPAAQTVQEAVPEYPGLQVAAVHVELDEHCVHVPFAGLGHDTHVWADPAAGSALSTYSALHALQSSWLFASHKVGPVPAATVAVPFEHVQVLAAQPLV